MYLNLRSFYRRNGFVVQVREILELIESPEFMFSQYIRWQIIRRLYTICFEFIRDERTPLIREYSRLITDMANRVDYILNEFGGETPHDDMDNQIIDSFILRARNELSIGRNLTSIRLGNILNQEINLFNIRRSNNNSNANREPGISSNQVIRELINKLVEITGQYLSSEEKEDLENNAVLKEDKNSGNRVKTTEDLLNDLLDSPSKSSDDNDTKSVENGDKEDLIHDRVENGCTSDEPSNEIHVSSDDDELFPDELFKNESPSNVSTCEFNEIKQKLSPSQIISERDNSDLFNIDMNDSSSNESDNLDYINDETNSSMSSVEQQEDEFEKVCNGYLTDSMESTDTLVSMHTLDSAETLDSMETLDSSESLDLSETLDSTDTLESSDSMNQFLSYFDESYDADVSSNGSISSDSSETSDEGEMDSEESSDEPRLLDYFPDLHSFSRHWNTHADISRPDENWTINLIKRFNYIRRRNNRLRHQRRTRRLRNLRFSQIRNNYFRNTKK